MKKNNNFYGKNFLFTGDSISAGWRDDQNGGVFKNSSDVPGGRGWSRRICLDCSINGTNASVAGASLKNIKNRGHIIDQFHRNKDKNFDYVIMEGGFNDIMGENAKPASRKSVTPLGEMTKSFDIADFNVSTFAGALEEMFYYAKLYFKSAKLGFIITYFTPLSKYGGVTSEHEEAAKYWGLAKKICKKWDIAYLDLFDGTAHDGKSYSRDILKTHTPEYFPGEGDQIHLNSAGYDVISPYIAEWIESIT